MLVQDSESREDASQGKKKARLQLEFLVSSIAVGKISTLWGLPEPQVPWGSRNVWAIDS